MSESGCDLCGLPLGRTSVTVGQGATIKRFCCKGCAQVYQLAEQSGTLAVAMANRQGQSEPEPGKARPAASVRKLEFSVAGMSCEGCAAAVQRVLKRQRGVLDASVSLTSGQGSLTYDPAQAEPAVILRSLDRLGYHAFLNGD